MRSNSEEIEATLIIWSENPQAIVRQIADLTSIANYRLVPQESQRIHDLYLDTPEQALQTQKLALRVREIEVTHWLTLKGQSRSTDWGGVKRLEIEAPWSEDALTRVIKELADRKITLKQQSQDFHHMHPLDVMASLGLEVIQDRETQRQVRNIIFMGEEGGPVLAEMGIDSVVYHFSDQTICHYELEIEAKVRNGLTVLRTLIESLVAMYGPTLRGWDHGKLATGKAIEWLLNKGSLEGLLEIDNHLKPGAYDKMSAYLKSGNV